MMMYMYEKKQPPYKSLHGHIFNGFISFSRNCKTLLVNYLQKITLTCNYEAKEHVMMAAQTYNNNQQVEPLELNIKYWEGVCLFELLTLGEGGK